MPSFKNRVYGCAVIKSVNSNYNADFSHQPRTLPDGRVYATDKALKYSVKNYFKKLYPEEKVFYFKKLNEEFNPMSLIEAYADMFPDHVELKDEKKVDKVKVPKAGVAKDILECIDIRLFGATFALKAAKKEDNVAISVHGPVQINHGINIWPENNIYSEQIMSPFRNPGDGSSDDEDKAATTLGRQSKLREGHYLHHFSVNPQNLVDIVKLAGDGAKTISESDIKKLKEAFSKGVTYYDSSAKAGTDNELLIWVQLKEKSKTVLPNFTELVSINRENGTVEFDLSKINSLVQKYGNSEIESVEVYYSPETTLVNGLNPSELVKHVDLETGKDMNSDG
ncbi:MAG: type I CRISPR-associated protein Cas7 [Balneolaceae bacterium]